MKILSLYWHGVVSDSIGSEDFAFPNPTESMFREQIQSVVKKYTPISIFDFTEITSNKRPIRTYNKPPVLLGFDDGFKNILDKALPILNEFNVPALFFVNAETLKNPDFVPWFVEVKHLIRRTKKKTIVYGNAKFDLDLMESKKSIFFLFKDSLMACRSEETRQEMFTNLAKLLDVERPKPFELDNDLCCVTKEDLSNLGPNSLLTVASHTMTHRFLDSLSYEEQVYELEQSDVLLKKFCPSYYPVLSYPLGVFNEDSVKIAKNIYKSAFAVYLGASYNNLYKYPRNSITLLTGSDLARRLSPMHQNYISPLKRLFRKYSIKR